MSQFGRSLCACVLRQCKPFYVAANDICKFKFQLDSHFVCSFVPCHLDQVGTCVCRQKVLCKKHFNSLQQLPASVIT
jgi:hypothetical protein